MWHPSFSGSNGLELWKKGVAKLESKLTMATLKQLLIASILVVYYAAVCYATNNTTLAPTTTSNPNATTAGSPSDASTLSNCFAVALGSLLMSFVMKLVSA